MSGKYPDGRYKMTNPRDTTGDGWTIEQVKDGRLRGPMTTVEEWIAVGYTFEPVVILTVMTNEQTNTPNGEGYYAFEGSILCASVERTQLVVMVRRNAIDDQYYAYRLSGYPVKVSLMIGTWTKLKLPWD